MYTLHRTLSAMFTGYEYHDGNLRSGEEEQKSQEWHVPLITAANVFIYNYIYRAYTRIPILISLYNIQHIYI